MLSKSRFGGNNEYKKTAEVLLVAYSLKGVQWYPTQMGFQRICEIHSLLVSLVIHGAGVSTEEQYRISKNSYPLLGVTSFLNYEEQNQDKWTVSVLMITEGGMDGILEIKMEKELKRKKSLGFSNATALDLTLWYFLVQMSVNESYAKIKDYMMLRGEQISDVSDKFYGMGMRDIDYSGNLSYENEVFQSVFRCNESDFENLPFHNRFAAKTGVRKPTWNNVQRVNKQNQFVPLAVQTRTGNNPVNTAKASGTNNFSTARQNVNRQTVLTSTALKVNTVKPIVNGVRPANVFHKTHSPSSRPFKRTTVLKTNFSNQKVYTAKVKQVSTVGVKWDTAVKASAGCDNPHRTLKNKGIIDSGCSRHMTGNKAYLADFQDFNGGPVAFGGSKGYITGKGKIKTGKLDFEDVSFVKELQPFNLFSVSQMCDKKNKVLFTDRKIQKLQYENTLCDLNKEKDVMVENNEIHIEIRDLIDEMGKVNDIGEIESNENTEEGLEKGRDDVVDAENEPDKFDSDANPLSWTIKGISVLANSLGKPLIINDMTAKMCQLGKGIIGYVGVLAEVDACKESK
ncbi:hypothetical protein Tco_1230000 [Tanacetum coccineum]